MAGSFISSNDNTRYLYISSEVTKIMKFLLFEYIRNLLKAVMISNHIRYLQSYILARISFINEIK